MSSIGNVIYSIYTMMIDVHWLTPTVLLYAAAAIVSRFWHKNMWMVYLAMAAMAAWLPPH